jgi:hypothetical protein
MILETDCGFETPVGLSHLTPLSARKRDFQFLKTRNRRTRFRYKMYKYCTLNKDGPYVCLRPAFYRNCIHKYNSKILATKQAENLCHNSEVLSCNHCCSGKAVNITYSEWAFVALFIKHAIRMRHIYICGLSGRSKYLHIIS